MPSAPITFNLTGTAPSGHSMSFVQNGLSLTVSTALYDGTYLGTGIPYEFGTPTLTMTSNGIGAENTYFDAETWFDADGKFEMATLAFGQTVRVTSIKLTPMGTRGNPNGVDTEFIMFGQGLVRDESSRQFIDPTDFTNTVSQTGTYLGIGAVTYLDGFSVASITVEIIDPSPVLTSVADTFAFKSSDAPRTLALLANDENAQSILSINTTGLLGAVTLAPDGQTVSYNAGLAFDYLAKGATATEQFTYTVLGTDGTEQTQTVTITVTGSPNEITGTSASEGLLGSERHDIILGLGGNDSINGLGGNDEIDGGTGRDVLHGDGGNDVVNGGDSDDFVYGDAGNDTVIGGAGTDRLYGGDGNDSLDGSNGSDRMYGDAGNDVLVGGASTNILDGGTGVDTMTGGGGNDSYFVDDAADLIFEFVGGGTDLVYSTASYTLADNVENLTLTGLDALNATGNVLANRLTGNDGSNFLYGYDGNDRLDGGLGNDDLVGGKGRDILTGGAGADDFVFGEFGSANYDTVTDFNATDDTILLSGTAMSHAIGGLTAAEFGFATSIGSITIFASTAAQRIIYDQARGDLYYDADGNGSGAKQLIASLVDGTILTINDILFY
jgi:VCBS repeat-containing protein